MILNTTNASDVHFSSLEDLVKFGESSSSTPDQWKKFGYANEGEFKQLTHELLMHGSSKEATELVLRGRITGFQTKEILQLNHYERHWCLSAIGIQAIASRRFSSMEIASIGNDSNGWSLTKNGMELMKRGLLTPAKIKCLLKEYRGVWILCDILGDVQPDGTQHSPLVDALTTGRISDRQATEILQQDPGGIRRCIEGIQAIELGMFSIAEMAQMKYHLPLTLILSKNGSELTKRGLLTPAKIKYLLEKDRGILRDILGDVQPDGTQLSPLVDALTAGRISDRQARNILQQGPDGIRRCIKGIPAIELGMFSIARISHVRHPLDSWAFSKNGVELMKRGLLTLDKIKNMLEKDSLTLEIILGDIQPDGMQHSPLVDALAAGRISDRQAAEILQQDPDGIQRCIRGIRAIEIGMFSIAEMAQMMRSQHSITITLIFSKNGMELMKRGLLTLDKIKTMVEKDLLTLQTILGDVQPDGTQNSPLVDALTAGRITNRQAAEILQQDPDGIRRCIERIQAIELGMFSIPAMAQMKDPGPLTPIFSKNGMELMKRGLLTLDKIECLLKEDERILHDILESIQRDGTQHSPLVDALTAGRITDRQAAKILQQGPDGIRRCIEGIPAIELGMFSIAEMVQSKYPLPLTLILSKNGMEFMKRGLLTPAKMKCLLEEDGWMWILCDILGEVKPDGTQHSPLVDALTAGLISDRQAAEILQQGPDGIRRCIKGIQAIELGMFSIAEMAQMKYPLPLTLILSENGWELTKRGLLTPAKINCLLEENRRILHTILGDIQPNGTQYSPLVDALTAGRITDRQAAEILQQDSDGIRNCIEGIQAIELGMFSIAEMAQMRYPPPLTLILSKNGSELIKRGLLNLTKIETLHEKDCQIIRDVLGAVQRDGTQHSSLVDALTAGRITDQHVAEILQQDPDGIRRCIEGIPAIELGMFSIPRIAKLKHHLGYWAFSKNGMKLMTRRILNLDTIQTLDEKGMWILNDVFGDIRHDGTQHSPLVDALTAGRITDRQVAEILEKDADEIKKCIDRIRETEKDTISISETAPSKIPNEMSQSSDSASSYSESSSDE